MLGRTVNKSVDLRRQILGGALLAGLIIVTVGVVRGVNLLGPDMFEITDGNVLDDAGNPAPDWDALFGTNSSAGPPPGPVSLVNPIPGIAGHPGVASQFTVDPLAFDPLVGQEPVAGGGACASGSGDPTVYTGAGGEKNGDVLSTDTWGAGSIPNNKDDLSNVYTAAYDRGDGKLILYFGLERVATNGSAHVDFEFYHNKVGLVADSPDAANGCEAGHFTGTRADGDIIITMDFDNGGRIGNPEVRRFNGTTQKYVVITPNANSIVISQNTTNVPCGSWECRDTSGIATPTLITNAFVEGYLDTGDPQVNFTGCLSSFNVHTRSSPSFTATLKDFALGNFDTCSSKSGQKFNDLNGNGVKDSGEPGLNNWQIKLFADGDGNGILSPAEFTAGALSTATTATVNSVDGVYSFSNLNSGDYIVCEVAQATWTESLPNATTTNKADCSTSSTLGAVGWKVHLTASTHEINNDFGNFQQGTKSGVKFNDLNGNGTKDTGEPGLNNWVIRAYVDTNGDGTLQATETTIAQSQTTATVNAVVGSYKFTLNPGKYVVCEVAQTGWTESRPSGNTKCSAISGLGAAGFAVTITSGSTEINNDFGNFQQGTKSGVKFNDLNANGVKDAGEPGLINWVIRAYVDTNGDGTLQATETTIAQSQTTAADGSYTFTLNPGKYVVCEVSQSGWTESLPSGNTKCAAISGLGAAGFAVTITSGSTEINNNFGNFRQGTKSGVKFNDLNANGTKDVGDPGLSGWVIRAYVDTNGDGTLQATETTIAQSQTTATVAGVDGFYSFSLNPGKYVVCEVLQATWTQSRPSGNTKCAAIAGLGAAGFAITVTSGSTEIDNDFGNFQPGTKSGVKFNDLNANGTKDALDPGLNGWVIRAYVDADGDGALGAGETTIAQSQTTATVAGVDGFYRFTLNPGKYVVCEVLQATWTQSRPSGNTKCAAIAGLGAAGFAVTITSGSSEINNNFGNFQQGTKSGVKFNDLNNNGVKDAGEPGLNGWDIRAYTDDNGDGILQATETTFVTKTTATVAGIDGSYLFTLNPGKYVVCEVLQSGWHQSFPTGNTKCALGSGLGAAGYAVTITSGSTEPNNNFGNNKLFRLIILTCSEINQNLIVSTVDSNGVFGGPDDRDTIATPPPLAGVSEADLQQYLCNLGGAQYNNLPADDYTKTTRIPKP